MPRHRASQIWVFVGGLLAALPGVAAQAAEPPTQTPREVWQAAINDQYVHLADTALQLSDSATAYCRTPSDAHRKRLESDWLTAYQAWQRVRYVDFGPIEQQSRAWQLQFWPDRKNLVGKKVDAWLKAPQTPDPTAIAADSVAIQGFPALEYLLFDETLAQRGVSLEDPAACQLMTAIVGHIAATTDALARDWQAFASHYLATDGYADTTLLAAMRALETLDDKRLAEPMGLRGKPRNGYLADAWRSERSLDLIAASLAGLRESFLPGVTRLLEQRNAADLAVELDSALRETQQSLAELPPGLAPGLDDEMRYRELQSLYIQVAQLRDLVNRRIAGALGITRGFNASDGD